MPSQWQEHKQEGQITWKDRKPETGEGPSFSFEQLSLERTIEVSRTSLILKAVFPLA